MSEFISEHDRYEQRILPHDLGAVTPEQLALQALIDQLTKRN